MSYREVKDQDFRLVILRALAAENDYRSNDSMLTAIAEQFAHRVSRDYCKSQIRWLEDVGAVTVSEQGSVLIATLTQRGHDHVDRRATIDGVKRPSPPGE